MFLPNAAAPSGPQIVLLPALPAPSLQAEPVKFFCPITSLADAKFDSASGASCERAVPTANTKSIHIDMRSQIRPIDWSSSASARSYPAEYGAAPAIVQIDFKT